MKKIILLGISFFAFTAFSANSTKRSGNAVQMAEENARASAEAELRNNKAVQSPTSIESENVSTVYPKSASPDVRDSYPNRNQVGGAQGKRHQQKSTGSTTLDSLSGSSSLPEKSNSESSQ